MISGLQTALDSKIGQLNFVAPLTGSTSGSSITIESLFKPTGVVAGTGIHLLANDGTGLLNISTLGVPFSEQDIRDRIITNVNTLGNAALSKLNIISSATTGVFLGVDPTEWATKQDLLTTYNENASTPTYIVNTDEANGIYAPFTSGTAVNTSTHTEITIPYVMFSISNTATSGTYTLSIELQSGTANHLVIGIIDGGWASIQHTDFTGLTTSWQTYTMTVNANTNGTIYFMLGRDTSTPYTQTAGTIKMRNFQVYTGGVGSATISAPTLLTNDITSSGTVQCVSLVQTSDERIKENVTSCDLDVIQKVFDNIEVKQYQRTDNPGNRIGFIAQDFVANLPEEYDNITHMTYDTGNLLYGLDYARIVCILWGTCKKQKKTDRRFNNTN